MCKPDHSNAQIETSTDIIFEGVNTVFLERVSPEIIYLRPPEKLVIEIKATGRYNRIQWQKNVLPLTQEFPNYNEILVYGTTTQDDLGLYEVNLVQANPIFQRNVPPELDFSIIPPGMCVNLHVVYIIIIYTYSRLEMRIAIVIRFGNLPI